MQSDSYSTPKGANGMKTAVKAALGRTAFAAGWHRRRLAHRGVVVAFHRISDAAGRSLNCSPAVFEGLCRFFKRHFSVTPLSELVWRLRQNQSVGGMLSITFDDGYKDNFEVAAPILKSLDLPATFFVATNFIDSVTVPFWDEHEGVKSEWMSWADVRGLAEMGFDIGGHTMNHADLGAVSHADAATEIAGCRDALEQRLGSRVRNFAYPFGGAANINAAARRLIADAGFECCLSCHGGIISPRDDVFDLPREPINTWIRAPYQYGFELLAKAGGAAAHEH